METLYTIDVGYANAGVVVDEDGVIVEAAPIFKWMVGKELKDVIKWKKIQEWKKYVPKC